MTEQARITHRSVRVNGRDYVCIWKNGSRSCVIRWVSDRWRVVIDRETMDRAFDEAERSEVVTL